MRYAVSIEYELNLKQSNANDSTDASNSLLIIYLPVLSTVNFISAVMYVWYVHFFNQ